MKKKESDHDQLATESSCCQITAEISDKPLSKPEIRHQKLENRKTMKQKASYKMPSLQDVRSGKWLNDTLMQ